jgi:hypothetical protein
MNLLMGAGPKGGGKPYRNCLQPDGSYKETRIWFVPKRKGAATHPRTRTRKAIDRQSTPQDMDIAA